MADQFQFDPAPVDRAIARLRAILDQATRENYRVSQLQHVTQPGGAPETKHFHTTLIASIGHLKDQHVALVKTIDTQIRSLEQVKQKYAEADHAAVNKLGEP